jgi:PAS domain S-box-containing protein
VIINTESSANANDIQDVAEWLEVSSIPLSDRRKRQLGWLIVLSDRTEQWRMEQALREQNTYLEQEISDRQRAEEAYLNLVDYSLQGLAIFQDERFVFANAAMTDMLGYTVEELLALEPGMVWQLIHPDDRALVAHYTQTRNAGLPAPTRYEVRLLHKAGAVRWAEVFVAPITFLGRSAYQIAYIDITERKQAEEALRKLQQAIEQSPSSIMITDRDAHIEYVNPRFTSLTGYTLDEVRGTTPRMLKTAHTATTVYQDLWATILAGNEWRGEFCNRTKTGDIYWEWASIAPIVDAAGQITHFVAVKEDITERKRTQAQLQQQQQALAMFRERERLARELHDTVGQVLGYVQAQLHVLRDLLHRGELTEADLILERLTTVAHETHGDMRAFIVGVQTGDTLKQGFVPSVERYLERYEQIYGIQTTLTVAPNLVDHPFAPVVEAHLVRIIQEALSNTRKHAEASQIDVTFEQYADQMRLVIADNGRGFDPSALPADTAQGFGLQSMQERVREIEGIFRIETPSGGGTHVIVHVPLQNLDAPRIKGLRVLLVDDQQLFLEGIQNMLTSRGIPVVGTARNGQEALEQARCLRPDVILMDVDMPVCDGLEATRRIKAELPDIQIVMLTVSADDDTLFEAIKGGAVGYLLKNLDVRDFFALLAGLERGEVVLAPEMAQKLVREFARPYQPATAAPTETKASAATEPTAPRTHAPDAVTQLTEREFEVLGLVAQGHTYRAVGERMGYSERTIKTVMSSILKKLHLKNRAAAVAYARKLGLASEGSDQD